MFAPLPVRPASPAPVESVHVVVVEHLKQISCEDSNLNAIIKVYSQMAIAWHTAIATVLSELASSSSTKNLNKILKCLQDCTDGNTPPPPFLVGFEHDFLHSWTRIIVGSLANQGACRWSPAEKQDLSSSLKTMIKSGLCHRRHVTIVDAGKNPAWLTEYVRSILEIWKDGQGKATPATIQCFKKLACCTSDAMSLICAYSQMVLGEEDADLLENALYCIQKVVFSSFGTNGISNTSATQCISYVKVQPRIFSLLAKVDALLVQVWDLITNPRFEFGECIVLPGIVGSHVEEFSIPSVVVKKGCTKVILNCINSALPLSFVNPGADHFVTIASTSKSLAGLKDGVVECLESMLKAERFGGEHGCSIAWWDEYRRLTRQVLSKACKDLGFDERGTNSPSAPSGAQVGASTLFELRVQRDHFVSSKVTKVLAAGSLFDETFKVASGYNTNVRLPVTHFYKITDPKSGQEKADPSLAGRLLVDLNRVVQELGLYGGIVVESKLIVYKAPADATKMLHVLIEYMKEHSKSRRKKGESMFLKRNARPDHDKRKKPRRPRTPGSTVAESWAGSVYGDELNDFDDEEYACDDAS